MATIAERIRIGLSLRNMRQIDLVERTGIGKSSISTYISGEYEPKQKNIYKIAQALNVSEAWLMGYDVPMERENEHPSTAKEDSEGVAENTISFIGRNGERVVKTYTPEQMETIRRLLDAIPSEESDL